MLPERDRDIFFQHDAVPSTDTEGFSAEVMAEVARFHIDKKDLQQRPYAQAITVNESGRLAASDHGFMVERTSDGFMLSMSVIDVASFLSPDSAIDKEAYRRMRSAMQGTHRHVAPMLPRTLSERVFALSENEVKPTLTFSVSIDHSLHIGEPTIALTKVKNLRQLSYQDADRLLSDDQEPLHHILSDAQFLAHMFYQQQRTRGAFVFYDLEKKRMLNQEAKMKNIIDERASLSFIIHYEFVLFFNEIITRALQVKNVPLLFRNQLVKDEDIGREERYEELIADRFRLKGEISTVKFSPFPQGHYGLNLDAYASFFSPITHYVDVVNQRNLLAYMLGQKFPYPVNRLKEVAGHLNTQFGGDDGEKEEKDNGERTFEIKLRNTREDRTVSFEEMEQNSITPVKIRTAQEDQFLHFIHTLAREETLSQELIDAIHHRLHNVQVSLPTIFEILFLPKMTLKNNDWNLVTAGIISRLAETPYNAVSLITMATQRPELGWSLPTYQDGYDNETNLFTCAARIKVGEKTFHSGECKAEKKKKAAQLAAYAVLAEALGLRKYVDQAVLVGQARKTVENDKEEGIVTDEGAQRSEQKIALRYSPANYKGTLMNYCQKLHVKRPVYEVKQKYDRATNTPMFWAKATVEFVLGSEESEEMYGRTRKEAEQQAAASLIEKLAILDEKDFSDSGPRNETVRMLQAEARRGNFPGALAMLSGKIEKTQPTYTYASAGLDVICRAEVKIWGETHSAEAPGKNNKEAKRKAAKVLFDPLFQRFQDQLQHEE